MKKYSFAIALAILACLFLVSCDRSTTDSEPEMQTETSQVAFDDLNDRIAEFEKEYGFGNIDTRAGFWAKLGWILGADAFGALIGAGGGPGLAMLVSAGSSIAAAITVVIVGNDSFTKSTVITDDIISSLGNTGLEHNQILQKFFQMNNPDFNGMTTEDISEYIIRKVYEIIQADNQTELPSLDKCLTFSSQKTMLPYNNIDELASQCILSHPELTNEITVIKHCVQTYTSIEDPHDVVVYSKGISTIIEESSIPVTSKNEIKSGASVAAFSKLYWDDSIK